MIHKPKSLKLLEETPKNNLHDFRIYKDFVNNSLNAQTIEENFDYLHFIKIKNFFFPKDRVKRMQNASHRWEEIFTTQKSDKGLASTIYKELFKSIIRQPNLKMGKRFEQTLHVRR